MTLPGPLSRLPLGDVLGWMRTGGSCPLHAPDGAESTASLWFVVSRDRCWLVAATAEVEWMTASTDVALERGWTWDAVRVGGWSAPLRTGTRGVAEGLMQKWRLAEKGGEELPADPPPLAPERAKAAAGAGVPEWIPASVPAAPDARWLFAVDTGERVGLPGRAGEVERANLWFAASDRHAVLCTAGGTRRVWPIEHADGLRARWATCGDAIAWIDARGDASWELAIRSAFDAREPDRAVALTRDAFVLGHHARAWAWIGLLALGAGEPEAAVGALLHELALRPDTDRLALANDWSTRVRRVERASVRLPDGLLAECAMPARPRGLPWPPEGPTEAVALASALDGITRGDRARVDAALAQFADHADRARAAQARGAALEALGDPDAWRAWWDAADALRATEPDAVEPHVERALAGCPDPAPLRWTAACWALDRHADPNPHWRAALPAVPPTDLPLDGPAWSRLAELAERVEAWEAAAVAWRATHLASPEEREALRREAALLEQRLGRPEHALGALSTLAERTDVALEPDPPRWWVYCELARLHRDQGHGAEAADALQQAVSGDFLHVEALDRAIALGEGVVDPARLAWWGHLRALLVGGEIPPGRAPRDTLAEDALDALHPSGVGWLERARSSIDKTEPPPIRDLTRGLERVDPTRHPELARVIEELAGALSIAPPPTYLFRGDGAWGLSAWPTSPPLLLVGHDHLDPSTPVALDPPALRFALGVELVHLAAKHPLLAFDGSLVGTSRSVYGAFGRYAGTAETVVDVVSLVPGIDQLAKIQTVIKLSKRVLSARSMVDKASGIASSGIGWLGWSREGTEAVGRTFQGPAVQFRLQADRAALLLTGDLGAAIDAILCSAPSTASHRAAVRERGLSSALSAIDPVTRLRIAGLLSYAAGL